MRLRHEKPITAARIEDALDGLAALIVSMGAAGEKLLPLYDRLERELAELKAKASLLDAVNERLRRSKDRTSARSC